MRWLMKMNSDEVDLAHMERHSIHYIDEHIEEINQYRMAYIQSNSYKFLFDVKKLEEDSHFDREAQANEDARFKQTYTEILKITDIDKRNKLMEQVDREYTKPKTDYETAIGILYYLEHEPIKMLKALNKRLYEFIVQKGDEEKDDFYAPEFDIINWEQSSINNITVEDVNKLKIITGWIAYIERPPHVEYYEKFFYCNNCHNSMSYAVKPKKCDSCGSTDVKFDAANSKGKLVQELMIIENFDDINSGTTPGLMSVFVDGMNINKYSIGDRIKCMGIIKQYNKCVEYLGMDAMSITVLGLEQIKISKEEMKKIGEIAKNPLEFIDREFAKSIKGEEYKFIKLSLVISMVGGSKSNKRNSIHNLIVGDPGLGKSELLKAVVNDSPKAIYVSDASGPGLTAAIVDINGHRTMVPGALVIADLGVLALDELDKMKREDTSAMHSAMEQGEFTKSKGGANGKFKTRGVVIAAANPNTPSMRFDHSKSLIEQVNLPESLLQRFDFIWILISVLKLNSLDILKNTERTDDPIIKKYIYYCSRLDPTIEDLEEDIAKYFDTLKAQTGDLMISARHLLAMKRVTQASAKLHLRERATLEDFTIMQSLFNAYLKQFNYSISNIYMPGNIEERINRLMGLFDSKKSWNKKELLFQSAMDESEFESTVNILKTNGKIVEFKNGTYMVS